jgi:tRNA threonylcarbamoyladenosine biosynthesis protein TsaB
VALGSSDVLLLALDTATPAVTVAVHDGTGVRAAATTVDARRHGELLAPQIARVLADAGVDRRELTEIVVGVGPGPYTGLRVGLVTARTLGAVLDTPVRGVCSLDVMAYEAAVTEPFVVVTNARRNEVYWAAYDSARRRTDGPHVSRPADAANQGPAAGEGAARYPACFPHRIGPSHPSAAAMARGYVHGALDVVPPDPLYLRHPDAVPPGARKRVLP